MKKRFNGMTFTIVTEGNWKGHITHHKDYKLAGIDSISTNVLRNKFCEARRKINGSICEYCYAAAQVSCYSKTMLDGLNRNTDYLTSEIITEIPMIGSRIARFESFGDLNNKIQAINYLNIARCNPDVMFGWWTKNLNFIKQAIADGWTKPKNVVIIYSSHMMNTEVEIKAIKSVFPFVDKVFSVTDKDEGVNCGAKSCLSCLQCYKKTGIKQVKELVKQKGFGSTKSNKNLV